MRKRPGVHGPSDPKENNSFRYRHPLATMKRQPPQCSAVMQRPPGCSQDIGRAQGRATEDPIAMPTEPQHLTTPAHRRGPSPAEGVTTGPSPPKRDSATVATVIAILAAVVCCTPKSSTVQ